MSSAQSGGIGLPLRMARAAAVSAVMTMVIAACSGGYGECTDANGVFVVGPFGGDCPHDPPGAVANLFVEHTEDDADMFRVSWTNPPQDDIDRVEVMWSEEESETPIGERTITGLAPRSESNFIFSSGGRLVELARYQFTAVAIDRDGNRSEAAIDIFIPGAAATGLEVALAAGGIYRVTWTVPPPLDDVTRVEVTWRRAGSGELAGKWTIHRLLPDGSIAFTIADGDSDGLLPATGYRFTAIAVNEDGDRLAAATMSITTGS